jgi:hypothetical protein
MADREIVSKFGITIGPTEGRRSRAEAEGDRLFIFAGGRLWNVDPMKHVDPLATCTLPCRRCLQLTYLTYLIYSDFSYHVCPGSRDVFLPVTDPCACVRPCVPCVSRLPPVSFYR